MNDSFTTADIDWGAVAQARLFHLGYPPLMRSLYEGTGRGLCAIYEKAKAAGVTTSLDMSLPDPTSDSGQADWHAILNQLLPSLDVFLPSIEEIYFMLDRDGYMNLRAQFPEDDLVEVIPVETYRRLSTMALEMGAAVCVIKTARRGYYLRTAGIDRIGRTGAADMDPSTWADRELWAHAYHVPKIASATGSGDSSIAGFLTALLGGMPPELCMRLACAAGHHNLTRLDALSGLPDWKGLIAFLESPAPAEDPLLEGSGFEMDQDAQVFVRRQS